MYITSVQSTGKLFGSGSTSSTRTKASELMFQYNASTTTEQDKVPKRLRNPEDKRPDSSNDEWNWINGKYDNIKDGSLTKGYNQVSFIVYEDTEDGLEEIKITLKKHNNGTTTISKDRYGKGNEVQYYEVDNTSGKILSKQVKSGTLGRKIIYKEDGTSEYDKSLADKLRNKFVDVPDVHY